MTSQTELHETEQLSQAEKVKAASEYASAFAKAHAKADKRISNGSLLPVHARMSSKTSQNGLTPWLRAQIDIYELILSNVPEDALPPSDEYFPVADVGQSANRGAVCIQGTVPSISTSTRIFAYPLQRQTASTNIHLCASNIFHFLIGLNILFSGQRFLTPEELMAAHGFSDYRMEGLSLNEKMGLVGRGMAATTLATILAPVAKALGYFRVI